MRCFVVVLLLFFSIWPPLFGGEQIVIMLTNPRSISSAFEKSMMARGDHTVVDEPWVASHMLYNGDEKLFQQLPPEDIVKARDYEGVKKLLYSYAENKPVFVKDMIWCIADQILKDDELLSDPTVQLAILIRNPLQSLESFYLIGSDLISRQEILEYIGEIYRYDALFKLAEKYFHLRGKWPIVVQAEELCSDPETTLKAFCSHAALPFIPEMLSWEQGMPEEWKHLGNWHLDAAQSKGFFVPPRDSAVNHFTKVFEADRPRLEEVYQYQKPFYEALVSISSLP